ncbi:MAG: hypothetical protein ACE1Y7_10255 [Lysobacteraceae bacterium]
MKKAILILIALLLVAGPAWAQTQTRSLGEIARKLRAARAKKDLSKVRVYTNDNLPKSTVPISVMGRPAATPSEGAAAAGQVDDSGEEEGEECDEQCWRGKFSEQRLKIRTAEGAVDLLQREYNLARTQHYQDPNAALREQYSNTAAGGRQLQDLLNQMNAKKREIQQLRQELTALEREMRRSGGKPGWARE